MHFLKRARNVSILDIGCGYDAELLCYFSDKISYGLGLDSDTNPEVISSLPSTAHGNLHFITGDINITIYGINTKLNLVTLIDFIEHISTPQHILAQARTLLKPNGVMIVLAPTWLDMTFLELCAFNRRNLISTNRKKSIDEHKDYYTNGPYGNFLLTQVLSQAS